MTNVRHFIEFCVSRAALALVLTSSMAAAAQAQEVDEEVVVTATRTQTAVSRLPARVDVITREEMEDRNYVTTVDALTQVPGINVVQSGGAGTITSVFARGTNSKHTLALFDGIRLNDASAPNGQYNFGQDTVAGLERIEVVRGAASSVYGSDAIGGVINFIPRVGGDRPFEPFFDASAGSNDAYRLTLGANGGLSTLSYAISAEHFETSGFNNTPDRMANNLGEKDGSSFNTVTGVADLRISENVVVRGLARYRFAETDLDSAALDRANYTIEDEYVLWRVGPRFTLFNDALDIDMHIGEVRNERGDKGAATTEGVRSFANWRNTLTIGDAGAFTDVSFAAGLEWQREEIDVPAGFSAALAAEEDAAGLYVLAKGRLADRIDLSASARRDDTDSFGEANTWNLGAVLDLREIGARVYASTGSSFKAPTLSERFSSSFYTLPNPTLVPEEGDSWEAGFDLRPFRDSLDLMIGATYFDTEIDSLIEYQTVNPATFQGQNRNVGVAEINGYEAFVELSPIDILNVRINYTYTDAITGLTGARLLRRPPHAWGGTVELRPIEPLVLTLSYLHRGDRTDVLYADTNPFGSGGGYIGNGWSEAYQILNLAGRYDVTEQVSVFASVNNLLDEEYEEPNAYRGAPQTFSIGVRGKF